MQTTFRPPKQKIQEARYSDISANRRCRRRQFSLASPIVSLQYWVLGTGNPLGWASFFVALNLAACSIELTPFLTNHKKGKVMRRRFSSILGIAGIWNFLGQEGLRARVTSV